MKKRFLFSTLLTVLPLLAFTACLKYPDKLPNPDELDVISDVTSDVADVVDDAGDVADTVSDVALDVEDAVDAMDAADGVEPDTDVVEPCIDGDDCDDGDPCTVGDKCNNTGTCVGSFVNECDDQIDCTDDACETAFDCSHDIKAGYCLVNGICYVADATDATLFGPCRACKPDIARDAMSADDTLTCDDSSACTESDHCASGTCTGTNLDCNDDNVCTDDSCDPATGCKTDNNTASCGTARCEGMMRYGAAVCAGGVCPVVTPENCDDGNPCTTDACKVSGCTHTARNGQVCIPGSCELGTYYLPAVCQNDFCPPQDSMFCDDGNICTEDYCSPEGGCLTRNDNTKVCGAATCDGMTFRPQVVCSGGLCPTQIPKNCADTNVCTDDTCTLAGCSNEANSAPCSDNNPCTENDKCKSKVCKSGDVKQCDDDLYCTADSCDTGTGNCLFTNLGYCIIDGACRIDGEMNPDNPCQKCSVGGDLDSWSPGQENSTCDVYPDGYAICEMGGCAYYCDDERGDCDGEILNGCETNLLNDPAYCGDCYTDCGTQVCSWGTCAASCAGDLKLCGGRCHDVTTSLEHCGVCDNSCLRDFAVMECVIGNCVLTGCDQGHFNVDLDSDNGCECASSGLEICDGMDNDCNGATDDVTVEMLATDPVNCGQCGRICNAGDRTVYGYCTSGNCVEVPCSSNHFDINKNPLDACEYVCVPAGSETCGNGVDEDCNGATDEGC